MGHSILLVRLCLDCTTTQLWHLSVDVKAASFFPAIVLGIFNKRVGTVPAICGMLAGIGFTAGYIIGEVYLEITPWGFGIQAQGIGTIGMLLNFFVTLALPPLFRGPDQRVRGLVDSARSPELDGAVRRRPETRST